MIYIRTENGDVHKIKFSSITQIRVENREFVFDTLDGVKHAITTLKDAKKILEAFGFKLLNKNNLVNLQHIESYDPNTNVAKLRDGNEVKVSRSNQKFMEILFSDSI